MTSGRDGPSRSDGEEGEGGKQTGRGRDREVAQTRETVKRVKKRWRNKNTELENKCCFFFLWDSKNTISIKYLSVPKNVHSLCVSVLTQRTENFFLLPPALLCWSLFLSAGSGIHFSWALIFSETLLHFVSEEANTPTFWRGEERMHTLLSCCEAVRALYFCYCCFLPGQTTSTEEVKTEKAGDDPGVLVDRDHL